jgi:hypothetical protein
MIDYDSQPRVRSGWLVLIVAVCLLGITAVLAAFTQRAEPATTIVGTLNGEPFTREAFEAEIRFGDLRSALANQPATPVNKPALLNRMVGDALILQVARSTGTTISDAAIDQELVGILESFGKSETEMREALAAHDLTWQDFRRSVGDYMTLITFFEDKLLVDVPPEQQQTFLQNWMGTLLGSAAIDFDEAFINEISAP